ncbi:MAG: acylphosphatase [Spirochaetae bacterium HGW-Spirochaetae-7]|nr:MAG: acylphosphatase [Spirochaetae bacterium HGW-Spirochaetae-7]
MPGSDEPRETAFLALVRGRVQGVGFRYEARSFARALGIRGWIMNLSDGGVETFAEGPQPAILRYQAWLRQGPPGAKVESVDITERAPKGTHTTFTIE